MCWLFFINLGLRLYHLLLNHPGRKLIFPVSVCHSAEFFLPFLSLGLIGRDKFGRAGIELALQSSSVENKDFFYVSSKLMGIFPREPFTLTPLFCFLGGMWWHDSLGEILHSLDLHTFVRLHSSLPMSTGIDLNRASARPLTWRGQLTSVHAFTLIILILIK